MNDQFVPGMKLVFFVKAELLPLMLELFVCWVSLAFIYGNKTSEQDPGSKVRSKRWALGGSCQRAWGSVFEARAETPPEHWAGPGRGPGGTLGLGLQGALP